MKTYRVKGKGTQITYVSVYEEREDEIYLVVTKQTNGEQRISRDRISRNLFNACIETGYLVEEQPESVVLQQKLSA